MNGVENEAAKGNTLDDADVVEVTGRERLNRASYQYLLCQWFEGAGGILACGRSDPARSFVGLRPCSLRGHNYYEKRKQSTGDARAASSNHGFVHFWEGVQWVRLFSSREAQDRYKCGFGGSVNSIIPWEYL
ncbi:hypothetical protein GCM10017566_64450 [Amycolatopsis bartoniae]|uniref:Uncharacterized protein n=1 Tax=Amycolatopsis bartoniae TaxID=941986 RepID=A0A8H9J396_9PSEU|nr:hypothetical protein GCM10017566_64450 [Amycolatopsis bartoniae]